MKRRSPGVHDGMVQPANQTNPTVGWAGRRVASRDGTTVNGSNRLCAGCVAAASSHGATQQRQDGAPQLSGWLHGWDYLGGRTAWVAWWG